MGRLEELAESGEITHTSRAESGDTMRLKTFATGVTVSRKLMIDDDLGLLGDMTAALADHTQSWEPAVLPPTRRRLSRVLAAGYVGVSPTKFDEMVSDGRMPKPKRIDGRKVRDVRVLDRFFEAFPSDGDVDHNPWYE